MPMIAPAARGRAVSMIVVLKGSEKAAHPALFEQHLRLRTEVFEPGRGWIAPDAERCSDPYDDDDAVYFLDLDEADRLQASVRITPTVTSSLIADYFPHLVENGEPPRAPAIYERTRSVLRRPHEGGRGSRSAHSGMIGAMLQWCLGHGIASLQAVIDYASLPAYLALTPLTTPLGLPHPYRGGRCMAVRWPICPQLLTDIKNAEAAMKPASRTRRLH
jgi:N-acyl-L-homoserine lactone synthetase